MRLLPLACSCVLAISCGSGGVAPDDVPVSPYQQVDGWPRIPEGASFGKALGVAVDAEGRVFVTHTADKGSGNAEPIAKPTIFVFDPDTGALLDQLGAGLFRYPHGISVDREDALWVTDSEANRVFKLSHDGQVLLTLGRD